jgi:AAA domain-containing protein
VRRRIWRALNAEQMTVAKRTEIATRIHLLPLHGVPIALTYSPSPGSVSETDFAAALREKLNGFGVDWSLLILDPLSRWAGGGIESNNEAATRFVQVIETLTTVRGTPAVLVAHHSSQTSTQAGKSDARGVTGIRDGFRWQASMDAITSDDGGVDGVQFSNPKSNYSLRFRPLLLIRNTDPGIEGTLRLASESEAGTLRELLPRDRQTPAQREVAKTTAKTTKFEAECDAVVACLPEAPASMNRGELLGALGGVGGPSNAHALEPKLAHLLREGRVIDLSGGGSARARQYCRPTGGSV